MKSTAKRETVDQKLERIIKKHLSDANHTEISNCNFAGVQFDEAATEAITTIAEGLCETAKALGQLSYVLKASNVNIETMLRLDTDN